MTGNTVNTLSYTGIVTLSQYITGKKVKIAQVHNRGGSSLFNFLADCLTGDFAVANVSRPTKVKLLIKTISELGETYTEKSGFIYLLARPEKVYTTDSTKVRYSFIIPKEYFTDIPSESSKELGLGLYADNASNDCLEKFTAFCSLKDVKNLGSATNNLVVDWDLIINNAAN